MVGEASACRLSALRRHHFSQKLFVYRYSEALFEPRRSVVPERGYSYLRSIRSYRMNMIMCIISRPLFTDYLPRALLPLRRGVEM